MRKKNYVFGMVITATTLNGCSQDEAPVKTKNYYGVESNSSDTPKEAYYIFFAVAFAIVVFVVWGLKKLKK